MSKVLVADKLAEDGIKLLKEAGLDVDVKTGLKEDELIGIIPAYDALIVRSATKVTRPIIEAGNNLKIIGRAGVGVDNIDVEAATEKGIIVVNAPEGNTIAACEHTMAMMMALARNIPQAHALLKEGKWEKNKFMGVELRQKVLGVLGLGKIGGEVAKRAKAFEMDVIAYDPYVTSDKAARLGVRLAELPEVLAQADFLTVHMPLTDETRHLLDKEHLSRAKQGMRLINVARGGIVDEDALYESIKEGHLAGAAIDVFEKEPTTQSPLFELDKVIVTPHLGASTQEAQINVAVEVAREIVNCLKGEPVRTAVNLPPVIPELQQLFAPYLTLVEKIGKFISQYVDWPIEKVEIQYYGELADYDVTSLTNTFLKGLLRPVLAETVNYVNAPLMAKNRGIEIAEQKSASVQDYANQVTVIVETQKGTHWVAGTVLANSQPKIVRLDGYSIDAAPSGNMLVVPHIDRPNIIGPVGVLLGEGKINIAAMQVGRQEIGGPAVMVLNIDNTVPEDILDKLLQIDGVTDVKYIQL